MKGRIKRRATGFERGFTIVLLIISNLIMANSSSSLDEDFSEAKVPMEAPDGSSPDQLCLDQCMPMCMKLYKATYEACSEACGLGCDQLKGRGHDVQDVDS